jgi:hypothetical protein
MSSIAGAATISVQTTPAQVAAATGLTGGATTTFDDLAATSHSSISGAGVTITSNSGTVLVSDDYPDSYNTFGNSISNDGYAFNELYFNFAAPVSGFGFFFGASDSPWTLTAYDAANNLLDTLVIPVLSASNAGDFFGIKAGGIAYARLSGLTSDHIFLDNFTTAAAGPISAVPEPATWAMMIMGFGLVGAMARSTRPPPIGVVA